MLAFVHIDKTAGTTLKYILRQSFGPAHCDVRLWPEDPHDTVKHPPLRTLTPRDFHRTRWVYPRLKSIAGHPVAAYGPLAEQYGKLRFYTFLREPLARAASHFQHLVGHRGIEVAFDDFIASGSFSNWQTRKLCGSDDPDDAIRILEERVRLVGLVERFDESLLMLQAFSGEPSFDIRYRRQNSARNPQLKKNILADSRNRSMLEEVNRSDLIVYRYAVEEIFPRQMRQWGDAIGDRLEALHRANETFQPREPLLGTVVRDLLYKPLLPICSRGAVSRRAA